jgi:hypothetical protein
LLSDPVAIAREDIVPPLMACESDALTDGVSAVMVGYGASPEDPSFGIKRAATGTVGATDPEISVAGPTVGTCMGDSGGPIFVSVRTADVSTWRLAGVLSGGMPGGDCSPGPSIYTPVLPFVTWVEQSTQRDISPCGSQVDGWQPTPACTLVGNSSGFAATCGEPFTPPADDGTAPILKIDAPRSSQVSTGAQTMGAQPVHITVRALDGGWGVRKLSLTFEERSVGPSLRLSTELTDSIDRDVAFRPGEYDLRVRAEDYRSRVAEAAVHFTVAAPRDDSSMDCSVRTSNGGTTESTLFWLVYVLATRRYSRPRTPRA